MNSSEILRFLDQEGIKYEAVRVSDDEIKGYSSLFNYKEGTMTFIVPERHFADYAEQFSTIKIPFMIIGETEEDSPVFSSVIRVKSPRRVFFALLDGLFEKAPGADVTGVSADPEVYRKNSYIAPTATIGKNVRIGVGCVIEGNVIIGDNTEIHHNVVIRNKTRIGANCTIHSGTVVGEYGFGYVKNEQNEKTMLRHYGGVVIEDNVHIGDNCVIIRGAIDDTIIHKGVKINTMVHIAHNDEIGANTLITSPCHVCGSVKIGENCHIAGAIIRNQRNVGANATVGLGAVVVKDVEEGLTVVGNPAKPLVK